MPPPLGIRGLGKNDITKVQSPESQRDLQLQQRNCPTGAGPWRNTDHCQSYDQAGREQDKQNPGGSQRKVRWREDEVSGGHIPGTKQGRGG